MMNSKKMVKEDLLEHIRRQRIKRKDPTWEPDGSHEDMMEYFKVVERHRLREVIRFAKCLKWVCIIACSLGLPLSLLAALLCGGKSEISTLSMLLFIFIGLLAICAEISGCWYLALLFTEGTLEEEDASLDDMNKEQATIQYS